MEKPKIYCRDCGGAQVNHAVTYISVLLGALIEPWTNWMSKMIPESSLDWLGQILFKRL